MDGLADNCYVGASSQEKGPKMVEIMKYLQKSVKVIQIFQFTGFIIISTMKTTPTGTALLLLILASSLALGQAVLQVDVNKTVIQSNSQWSRVKLGFSGGSEPYQVFYNEYPEGWSQVIDYVYIPASQRSINRKYPCKIRATDQSGAEIKATIIFFVSGEKVYISDLLFGYDQVFDNTFFDSGIFKGKPTLVQSSGISTADSVANNADFQAQIDIVDKINSVSGAPGAGISDVLGSFATSGNNNTVTLVNLQTSMQLRDQLKNANTVVVPSASASGSATVTTIQSAASSASGAPAINVFNTPLAVPNTVTLTADQKQLVLISNIKANEISETSQQRSIESIFFRLPGPQELDTIILTADSFALIKTIQKVIQSDLSCEQKISYLSDFFGRIQSAISLKAFTATQLGVIVEGAQSEIDRLTQQIAQNRQSIDKLGITDLRAKLNDALVQLQDSYSKFNIADSQVAPKQALIEGYKKDIEILKTKAEANRQEIPVQKLQLNEMNANVAKLEEQYKDALAKRAVFEANIDKLNKSVAGYDLLIAQAQGKIDGLETEISKRQDSAQKLKQTFQTLQISIERQRTQITTREKTQAQITVLLPNLQQRADIEKKKMNNAQIIKIRDLVKNLQTILPNITKQVDDVNYKCNQLKPIQPQTQNNTTIYIVPPQSYTTYIQSCYQIKPDTSSFKTNNKINITPVGILDSVWTASFGNPYAPTSYVQANQFTFKEDFNCLVPSGLVSGSGLIKTVNKKFIQVDNGGRVQKLNLGACSRMESTNSLPKVGQKIYFRGQKLGQTEFNLYKGSCI